MRTIVSLIAVASVVGPPIVAEAAPLAALHGEAATNPAITLVWQRCGHGFHRGNRAWLDKGGGWHGPCVPNKPKATGQGPSLGGATTTQQLNQDELSRRQGGAPPAR